MKYGVLALFVFLAVASGPLPADPGCGNASEEKSLIDFFPPEDGSGEWKKFRAPEEYAGDDLFIYIDGGAEIYQEYGFVRVAVQDYADTAERALTVELYEMRDPVAAFGMFTFKRGDGGEPLDIGWEGRIESYYLNFRKGRYLVTITGFDQEDETRNGLVLVARAMDRNLVVEPGDGLPDSIHLPPDEGLIESSLKYYAGPLGLSNGYSFAQGDVFKIRKGLKAGYREGHELILLVYEHDALCGEIYDSASKTLREESRYLESGRTETSFWMRDKAGILIVMRPIGKVLAIVLNAPDLAEAENLFHFLAGRWSSSGTQGSLRHSGTRPDL